MPHAALIVPLAALIVFLTQAAAPVAAKERFVPDASLKRDQVPAAYKWDTRVWFKDVPAWEAARADLEGRIAGMAAFQGTLGKDAATLRACLDLYHGLMKDLEWLQNAAFTAYSVDRTSDEAKGRQDRAQALSTKLGEAAAFVEPEILALDADVLARFRAGDKGLGIYAHLLDDLMRRKAHVLTPALEGQLALSGDLRAGPYSMVNALHQDIEFPMIQDEEGKDVALTMSTFSRYRGSANPEVRHKAVDAFFTTLRKYGRSLAASLDMAVKADIFVARARGYGSAIEASLDANAIPVAVYDTLLATTRAWLPKTLHRYVALRRQVLGLPEMRYADLYNPLVPSLDKTLSYEQGIAEIEKALKPLGADYVKVMSTGMQPGSGWTDVYPNHGKRSGAYCTAAYGEHPFVFLNYMDTLDDAFTVAHEYGHAMHFHLANSAQAYPNAETPIFLAEIASTFNEEMLLAHLLKNATTRDEKLALLNKRLENIRTTIFRQIMFAAFERAIHAEVEGGGALTAERINAIYADLVREFYGPDFVMGGDDGVEWSYVPHFYYNFYVYQYATGLMSAIAMARRVQRGEEGAVERVMTFLKAGGSDYPLEILKRAGVDMTTAAPMEETFRLFEETLTEFERVWADK